MTDPTPPPTSPPPSDGAPPAASSPRRDRMLSELAGELRAARDEHRADVEQLRSDLAGLSGLVGDNADLLGRVVPRVGDLDVELADLAERIDALASSIDADADADAPAEAPALLDWPSLSVQDATTEWQALGDWVANVLGPFYEITREQLPDCWALHRPAVIELVWLRRAYVGAHTSDAAPSARADWHTRWRRDALANIAAVIDTQWCRPGVHYINRSDTSHHQPQAPRPPRTQPMTRARGQRPTLHNDDYASAADELTSPAYWGPMYQHARDADLQWRRHRAATAADPQPTSG